MENERREKELELSSLKAKISARQQSFRDVEQARTKRENELDSIERDFTNMDSMIAALLQEAAQAETGHAELEAKLTQRMQQAEALKAKADAASEEITGARIAKQDQENQFSAGEELLRRVQGAAEDLQRQDRGTTDAACRYGKGEACDPVPQ